MTLKSQTCQTNLGLFKLIELSKKTILIYIFYVIDIPLYYSWLLQHQAGTRDSTPEYLQED